MNKPITEARQIIRLSRVLEENGEQLNATVSDPYGNIPAWRHAFIAMARCVSKIFFAEKTPEEQDFNANMLLRRAAESMKVHNLTSRVVGMEHGHPGEALISDDVLQDERAKQVLSVWVLPAEECDEDCPADHKARTQISGDTSVLPTEEIGTLLSQIAFQHAFFESKGSESKRLEITAQIQKDFMMRFDLGQTRH